VAALADRLHVSSEPVRAMLRLFESEALITRLAGDAEGYVLTRLPSQLRAMDLVRLARCGSLRGGHSPGEGFLNDSGRLLGESLEAHTLEDLAELDFERVRTFAFGDDSKPSDARQDAD
jgi:hypothetical protein